MEEVAAAVILSANIPTKFEFTAEEVGESLELKKDNCVKTILTCLYQDNELILLNETVRHTCPDEPPPEHNCKVVGLDLSGCCKIYSCEQGKSQCVPVNYTETLRLDGCEHNVTMARCAGQCDSSTEYNALTNRIMHKCGCCVPMNYEKKTALLQCEKGPPKAKEYVVLKNCECDYKICRHETKYTTQS
ncbi:integumentary mucin B.1-like [Chiloscyllium plagiosum]|uniref:integumentary mucin B.1-like n=1 Tax=Chiloscyllium plagiosum TaxID=36176 RepID=UPI001CB83E1F|nr:integumentary mucin B.1-like [Chiloscyllium plagiosum]